MTAKAVSDSIGDKHSWSSVHFSSLFTSPGNMHVQKKQNTSYFLSKKFPISKATIALETPDKKADKNSK